MTNRRPTVVNSDSDGDQHVHLSSGARDSCVFSCEPCRVEPWLLLPQGHTCFLIKGQTIPTGTTAHFTDAGQSYIFRPVGSTVETSNHQRSRKTMALHGDSSGEFDTKSPADKLFTSFTDDINNTFDIISNEKITEYVGWEKRTVTLSMSGNLVSDSYKKFKATITVTPKAYEADGSRVLWTVEFEKIRHDVEDPVWIIDSLINYLKEIDGVLIYSLF
ncbi:LOW QUALITY PROTEIN: hypothetical protein HID58_065779 [Brassica napus]|uniref:Bet v I/Major latex protein domain-containing protein n=8 Tax=Brassica TaxID=3705 RepID=A0ABQ7ZDU1_BRANA|nr:LOW QUALITY PROTEIN: hypothetical protein HID58_065779 [Brassica napus]